MRRPTILLADDHPMMCAALRKILEPDHEVVGCAQDGLTLITSAADLKPDLVVLDVGLPILNGLDAARQLKSLMPWIRLVFLTMNRDPDIAREAYRIGASGYVLKHSMGEELLQVIQDAMRRPS
jgi:DNA-binding NarL/FixJ family response regulator